MDYPCPYGEYPILQYQSVVLAKCRFRLVDLNQFKLRKITASQNRDIYVPHYIYTTLHTIYIYGIKVASRTVGPSPPR